MDLHLKALSHHISEGPTLLPSLAVVFFWWEALQDIKPQGNSSISISFISWGYYLFKGTNASITCLGMMLQRRQKNPI